MFEITLKYLYLPNKQTNEKKGRKKKNEKENFLDQNLNFQNDI